jgi:hypothetical protein
MVSAFGAASPTPSGTERAAVQIAIEAAWIAAGSGITGVVVGVTATAFVAIRGYRNTERITDKTVRAGTADTIRALDAARDGRLWDKETAAYELTLSELTRMQISRINGQFSVKGPDARIMGEYLAQRESEGWVRAKGMLLAYAPQAIHDALDESVDCYAQAVGILSQLTTLKTHRENEDSAERGRRMGQVTVFLDQLMDVVIEADKKDQALANTIRAQLGGAPLQLPLPSRPGLGD